LEALSSDHQNEGPKKSKQDLFLLLSLLLLFLLFPALDHGGWPGLILGALTFTPLIVATIRMSHKKRLAWALASLLASAIVIAVVAFVSGSQMLSAVQWTMLAVALGLAVAGLFSYLRQAASITGGHLYTAGSIYLLLAMLFFALYTAFTAVDHHAFLQTTTGSAPHPYELLYFSLVTLTTVGYGDIVPIHGEMRMLAGLEAATGVLYVAITVATLVSSYSGPANQKS
jgi:hypothetical protein